ncbi:DNA-binding MarR family transcriptional regulator [Motilibacter peucedani]|uniref:DNA-binding MarR family transcriptional regulator n=1 Tax=Motilibacter peucedani TaxID=598650 RepID=A0A420XJY6_9ACTN|nr:MarR family transcriptional regulator [Motilibacter peucedani]RKS67930.1 DNA-binding MarR family transcriptional regulator [Motilibacter peucedani]
MTDAADLELARVLEQLVRVVRRLATEGELSLPAAAALSRLVHGGPSRLTDLAASEGVSQPGMTQLVTTLERAGLVTRAPSPDDGRVVLVSATADGEALIGRRRTERADALRRLLDQLSPDDRGAVRRATPALDRLTSLGQSATTPRTTTPRTTTGDPQ